MSFINSRFPLCPAFGIQGGPGFSTSVVTVKSGHEQRNADWSDMRYSYDVAMAARLQPDFEKLRDHFIAVGAGRENTFPFADRLDYIVNASQGRAIALTSTTFQLARRYVVGGAEYLRPIKLPRFVDVEVSGVPATYTLGDFGVVTIPSAPAASTVSWSGEFDVLVRYDVDKLLATITDRKPDGTYILTWSQGLPLVETLDP